MYLAQSHKGTLLKLKSPWQLKAFTGSMDGWIRAGRAPTVLREKLLLRVLPRGVSYGNCASVSQLQAKFEHLKRIHQEERMKLEEKRRMLEEESIAFSKKKATCDLFQSQTFMAAGSSIKKDKDRKK